MRSSFAVPLAVCALLLLSICAAPVSASVWWRTYNDSSCTVQLSAYSLSVPTAVINTSSVSAYECAILDPATSVYYRCSGNSSLGGGEMVVGVYSDGDGKGACNINNPSASAYQLSVVSNVSLAASGSACQHAGLSRPGSPYELKWIQYSCDSNSNDAVPATQSSLQLTSMIAIVTLISAVVL